MVDITDIHDNVTRATLIPASVLSLAEEGHFIDISDQDIQDKSKADILAKSLVILQVTWICLQCISQKVAGFPLTPLEIHTLVHAACATVMFALWFRKPLDVRAQTLVTGEDGFHDLIALFLMRSPALGVTPYDILDSPKDYVPLSFAKYAPDSLWLYKLFIRERSSEASYLLYDATYRSNAAVSRPHKTYLSSTMNCTQDAHEVESSVQNCQLAPRSSCRHSDDVNTLYLLKSGEFTYFSVGLSVLVTGHSKADLRKRTTADKVVDQIKSNANGTNIMEVPKSLKRDIPLPAATRKHIQHWHLIELFVNEKDSRRWARAGKAFHQEDIHFGEYSFNTNKRFAKYEEPVRDELSYGRYRSIEAVYDVREREAKSYLLCSIAQNVRPADLLRLFSTRASASYYVAGMMMLLSALYGGVHLSLWNYNFPTRTERLMWRISAMALGSYPGFLVGQVGLCLVAGIVGVPLWIIAMVFESSLKNRWSSVLRLGRRQRSTVDPTERQWSRLMAFEAKDNDYPSLTSSTFLWLKEQLPSAWRLFLAILLSPLTLVCICFPILYLLSRIYIVVESFISLRHVPVGVYVGVGWSRYIPHLSIGVIP